MNASTEQTRKQAEIASMLRQLVAAMVDNPGQVSVGCLRNGEELYFAVEVAAEDLNKLRGPNSRTADSLAVIVKAAGLKGGVRCHLQFLETGAVQMQAVEAPSKASSK